MRRTSLSSKLLFAALPLLAAIAALLTVTVLADLDRVDEAERDATLGGTWNVLLDASRAVTDEQAAAIDALLGNTNLNLTSAAGTPDADALDQAATATDAAVATLMTRLEDEPGMAGVELSQVDGALDFARQLTRSWAQDPSVAASSPTSPFTNYEVALRELHNLGSLLQTATGDPQAGRTLLGVSQLSDANLASGLLAAAFTRYELDPTSTQSLIDARGALNDITNAYDLFDTTTTPEWAAAYRRAGVRSKMSTPQSHVGQALNGNPDAIDIEVDLANTYDATAGVDQIQRDLLDTVIATADADAASTRRAAQIRGAVTLAAVLVAMIIAFLITRSITRRVRAVARNANAVATEQLPALVDALRDPRGRALPEVEEVSTRGGDELAELATSFNSLQRTLHDVAEEQVTVLRRGVSDIFVTMARRNRSLVDRQLALLDEFEAEVEDADVLASYYHLDHLATRMRRNSESLLVLANAEPRRGRVGPTEVDTVIRAAVGEVEEYRRVQVEGVEQLRVRGNVVADIAHLLAELLDNATAFSPPESLVQVGGRRVDGGYLVRIIDSGVGIAEHRIAELNDLLRNPPIVGLSVEPTLGISVVSLLANKHGIEVTLLSSAPGITVDVFLPPTLFADAQTGLRIEPTAKPPVGSDGAAIGDLASALGLPVRGGNHTNGHAYAPADDDHDEDAAVLAALEADLAAPEPAVDPGIDPRLTARLTDAFERADLTSVTGDANPAAPANGHADELPVRAGGAGAANALQSFRAGARAASEDLAAAAESTLDAAVEPAEATPPAVATLAAFPAPSGASLPAPMLTPPADLPVRAGELNRPPAPPQLPVGPSAQPVTPAHAAPAPRPAAPPPDLPTRNRAAAAAALAPVPIDETDGVTAALAAFDVPATGAAAEASALELPTRQRSDAHYTADYGDDPTGETPEVTAASPLGADQLRARLRAFQSEFRTGQHSTRNDASADPAHPSADLIPGDDLA